MTATTPATDTVSADEAATLDAAIADVGAAAERWAALGLSERAALLRRTKQSVAKHARAWARAAIAAKRVPKGTWEGEEWTSGPYATIASLDLLASSLEALAADRSPLDGVPVGTAPGGRAAFEVLPRDAKERVLLSGFTAKVWMPPGMPAELAVRAAGLGARRPGESGGVGLVLGAGNISSIGPLDALYELIAHNRTSVLKLNPTFASLKGAYEACLAPLVRAGFVRIVNGGAATGSYLAQHDGIGHVHITGSAATHDAIVWGTGDAAVERRRTNAPQLDKRITSELGGVSPVIVVPGRWSRRDLRFQAEHVATQRLHNSGHNCIASQMLILSADWDQREAFLAEIARVFDELPQRDAWYPESDRKLDAVKESYPTAADHHGRLLVEVTEETSQALLSTECFAPVLGHTALPGTGAEFLRAAVQFANDRLDGTLGAGIVVKPADRRWMGEAFDDAIADLRYGCVAVNAWTGFGFLTAAAPWGAYPGNTIDAVGSGIGVVHNALLIDGAERTVIEGPFRPAPRSLLHGELSLTPRPPWFVTSRTANVAGERLTRFAAKRTWWRLARVALAAYRG